MREIKFRAWDENEMFFPNSDAWFKLKKGIIEIPPKGYVLMQFTGLKDKNGTEIYEGDIVKHSYYPNQGYIEWLGMNPKNHYIGQYCITDVNDESISISPSKDLEVIGNIYENPNLLKK